MILYYFGYDCAFFLRIKIAQSDKQNPGMGKPLMIDKLPKVLVIRDKESIFCGGDG